MNVHILTLYCNQNRFRVLIVYQYSIPIQYTNTVYQYSTLYIAHSIPIYSIPIQYTNIQYIVHCTQHTVHSTQYTNIQYTVHSIPIYSTQCTVHSAQYTAHSTQCYIVCFKSSHHITHFPFIIMQLLSFFNVFLQYTLLHCCSVVHLDTTYYNCTFIFLLL